MATPSPLWRAAWLQGLARDVLQDLYQIGWIRQTGNRVVRARLAGTLRRLRADEAVEQVLIRGSFADGSFVPFLSDIDLVVRLRGPDHPSFSRLVALLDVLRGSRRRDPSLRDVWQFLIGEVEWPVLQAYGGLLQVASWCDEHGTRPFPKTPPAPPRLESAHNWRRLDQWTEDALRFALPGRRKKPNGVLFAAAEKKARSLASQLLGTARPLRRRRPPRSRRDLVARTASLLVLREECASKVIDSLGCPDLPDLPRPTPHVEDVTALAAAESLGSAFPIDAVVSRAGATFFLTTGQPDVDTWQRVLEHMNRLDEPPTNRCAPATLRSFALSTPLLPIRVVAGSTSLCCANEGHWLPLLLHEQLTSTALLIGADFRILADRPTPASGMPLITGRLARLLAYFAHRELVWDDRRALNSLRSRARIPEMGAGPREWYELNTDLFTDLIALLAREARDCEAPHAARPAVSSRD